MSSLLSSLHAELERLWSARTSAPVEGREPAAPPLPLSVASLATSWSSATRAAAQSGTALAGLARAAASRATLLRATAAAGAAIASTAVSSAAIDALHGASPSSPADDAALRAFVDAHPEVALPVLLVRAVAGDTRAMALLDAIDVAGPLGAPLAAARSAQIRAEGATDDALLALLRGRSLGTISDVVDLMLRIDAVLPAGDGLKAFNLLYRMVTEHIRDAQTWEDRPWILELDVLFAELYFDGVESCLAAPHAAPAAWRTLMERRYQPGLAPVQFALAGMSAHIIRDLPVAVVRTWEAMATADHGRGTAPFRDYCRVNDVLDAVEPNAMALLAGGLFKLLDDALEPADAWAAMAVIHAARDLAWSHADNLAAAGLASDEARAYVTALDTLAADAGRAALVGLGA